MGEINWRDERESDEPKLALSLPARPHYLALVRRVTAAFAEYLGVGEPVIGDLRTVVSEACSLAVSGSRPGSGPVRVEVLRDDQEFAIVVRERGDGLKQIAAVDGDSLPLSLKIITRFSSHFEVSEQGSGETALHIRLPLRPAE